MTTTSLLALVLAVAICAVLCLAAWTAGYRLGHHTGARTSTVDPARAGHEAVLRESLERLHRELRVLEQQRTEAQGQLREQVGDLRRETRSLSTALRRPHVRGRWGELHLRRAVELAGLVEHCDFTEQHVLADGGLRPDLVVHLSGGRDVVVDAKVPLDAYLDASSADDLDDDEREAHLRRHARQLRTHVDTLASKAYWRQLVDTPDFVVLFVPAESFLAAALETDPDLLEHAAGRQVVLATPSTLIALLRTIAHGWSHEALTRQAAEVHRLGRELHGRLRTFAGHLDSVGRSLNGAVGAYNNAIGSLESRVLVSARRFGDLGVTDDELSAPRSLDLRALDRRADDTPGSRDRTVAM